MDQRPVARVLKLAPNDHITLLHFRDNAPNELELSRTSHIAKHHVDRGLHRSDNPKKRITLPSQYR